jgi:hypothetical protein
MTMEQVCAHPYVVAARPPPAPVAWSAGLRVDGSHAAEDDDDAADDAATADDEPRDGPDACRADAVVAYYVPANPADAWCSPVGFGSAFCGAAFADAPATLGIAPPTLLLRAWLALFGPHRSTHALSALRQCDFARVWLLAARVSHAAARAPVNAVWTPYAMLLGCTLAAYKHIDRTMTYCSLAVLLRPWSRWGPVDARTLHTVHMHMLQYLFGHVPEEAGWLGAVLSRAEAGGCPALLELLGIAACVVVEPDTEPDTEPDDDGSDCGGRFTACPHRVLQLVDMAVASRPPPGVDAVGLLEHALTAGTATAFAGAVRTALLGVMADAPTWRPDK